MSSGNFTSTRKSLQAALEVTVSLDKKGGPLNEWIPKLATLETIVHQQTGNELKIR